MPHDSEHNQVDFIKVESSWKAKEGKYSTDTERRRGLPHGEKERSPSLPAVQTPSPVKRGTLGNGSGILSWRHRFNRLLKKVVYVLERFCT